MKIKKLFVAIAVSMAVAFSFTTCIEGGQKFNATLPAVVEYTGLNQVLWTAYGNYVPDNASASSLQSLLSGSCIIMSFEYNSEYQTGQYPVASKIQYQEVGVSSIFDDDAADRDIAYDYPLSSVKFFNESFSPYYKGRFFVETEAKLATNQALDYILYYKSGEELDANGARNIYLQAHLPATQGGTQDVAEMRALDLSNMIYYSGRDTTIKEDGIDYSIKYLKINLKYISGIENEVPVYKSASTQPIYIYTFKD
ncbi:MAG: hypothetical protein LBC48_00080 [Dysgonamonadaceae bacterium]|nr:hypothetical protein [Dysgonamonadaceae bacterium]